MAISTNGTVLARVAGALYNTQMSNATYGEVAALDPSALVNTLYSRDFSSATDATVATTLLTNLGLSSVEGLNNWVAAQLTAAGSNKGAKVVELLNGFAQMTSDATYGAAATAFNTKVDAALALSQTTGNAGGTFSAVGVVVNTDSTFTLSTDVDTKTGGAGNDTFNATSTTLTAGDTLNGGAGADTLAITLNGNPGAAELSGVETVNARLVSNSTVDAALWTGVTAVNVGTTSIADTTLTVTGSEFGTTYTMASGKVNGLSVTYADGSGTADTAKLSLGGLGSSTSDAAITVTANTTEAATISTSGTNYVDLTLGTAAKTVTITGSGANYVDLITSATSTTVDASANTGVLDLDMSSGLSAGDVIKGGVAATDKVTATVASTAGLNATITDVETLALTLTAAANVDFENTTGIKTVTLAESDVNNRLSNVKNTVTSITVQEAGDSSTLDVRADYATGAAATTSIKFSASSAATAAVAWDDLQISNIAALTVESSGSYDVTLDAVTLGSAATAVTLKTSASTADLNVGTLTGASVESFTITAASGDITVATLDNSNELTLSSVTISATGGADVTISADVDVYDSGTGIDSSLESISITGAIGSVITTNSITAGGTSTDTGSDVAITISLAEDSGGSDMSVITVVGIDSLDITLSDNAGIASEVSLITATAGDVGDINVTIGEDAILEFDGVTAVKGDIGNVTFTTSSRGAVSDIAGADTDITASEGNIGNITVTSGNAGTVELQVTATLGDVGDVAVTSLADDEVYVTAAGTVGDVTMTVAANDTLTTTINAPTIGNISITGAGDASVIVLATSGTATTGNITVTLTGTGSVASGIDISDVGSVGTVTLTGGLGDDTIKGSAGIDTISGGAGADTITGGAGADVISGGAGTDIITGGAGADSITLTETTSVTDVVVMTGQAATTTDTVTGFVVAKDRIDLDLSDMQGFLSTGSVVLAGDMDASVAADTTPTFATVSAAYDVSTAVTADLLVISGDYTASTLETALEVGGGRALTVNGTVVAGSAFLVVYDDGTDSYVAYVTTAAGAADNGTYASGDLTVNNMVKLVGITDSTTVVAANIDIIS